MDEVYAFVVTLRQRGTTLRLDDDGRLMVALPRSVPDADRRRLAAYRDDIVDMMRLMGWQRLGAVPSWTVCNSPFEPVGAVSPRLLQFRQRHEWPRGPPR